MKSRRKPCKNAPQPDPRRANDRTDQFPPSLPAKPPEQTWPAAVMLGWNLLKRYQNFVAWAQEFRLRGSDLSVKAWRKERFQSQIRYKTISRCTMQCISRDRRINVKMMRITFTRVLTEPLSHDIKEPDFLQPGAQLAAISQTDACFRITTGYSQALRKYNSFRLYLSSCVLRVTGRLKRSGAK